VARICYKYAGGTSREVEVTNGFSVMLGATTNGLPGIDADCGGTLSCATCHVYVDPAWAEKIPAPEQMEVELMEGVAAEQRPTSRLCCQIIITDDMDGLIVEVPDRQS
jgi:ferredoxin, 2Fe-2S